MAFGWYSDAGLTTLYTGPLISLQNADGSSAPNDFGPIYVGIPDADSTTSAKASSNPGVDDITITVVDASPGSGHEKEEVRLATTSGGLDTAVAGASLDLGIEILKGSANAVTVYVRVDDATGTVGTATELSIETNDVQVI